MKINAINVLASFAMVFYATASAQEDESQGKTTEKNEITTQRQKCDFKLGSSGGWTNLSRFYKEIAREESTGKPISLGTVLFYARFDEVEIGATTQDNVENRDSSPLNPNWKWPKGETLKIWSEVTFDDGNTWYKLIGHRSDSIKTSYWVSNSTGQLCGNTLSYRKEEGNFTTAYGMPNIFQGKPLIFSEIKMSDPKKISISITTKELTGNIANIQTNISINGKSIYSKTDSVDIFSGEFEASKIRFSTKRDNNQTIIESIQIPSNTSKWLHADLKISQRY